MDYKIEIAKWLSVLFGGKWTVLAKRSGIGAKNPAYLWDDKLWDLRKVSSRKSIGTQIRKAYYQIEDNPGGMILDISDREISRDDTIDEIVHRVDDWAQSGIDIVIIENRTLVKVIRYSPPPSKIIS